MKKALAIIFAVLFIDQSIKIWIKTTMHLGQAHDVTGNWFYLHFVENPGMAFGLTISDGAWGKLLLSVFRILAVGGIGYYMWTLSKKNVRPLLMVCVALIFAGALGNIIDSVFYGKFFTASDPWEQNVAKFVPNGSGYAGYLHGQVVDMFYFPLWSGHFPEKFPVWGGEEFVFFRPVFNIADASISVGVFLLIVFQKRLFGKMSVLPERKILYTNIFFAFIILLISIFLLLTYFTLFSSVHPLPGLKITSVLLLSLGLSGGMFYLLQRYPRFVPAEEVPASIIAEQPNTEAQSHEQTDENA